MGSSKTTSHQGFIYRNNVFAFQFHLESTPETINAIAENCRDEIVEGRYLQNEKSLVDIEKTENANAILFKILDSIFSGQ